MKTMKAVVVLAAALSGLLAAESAFAWHRGHVGVGLYFGVPIGGWGYPYYYPPYPYYPPSTVVVPAQPQTYIEQAPQSAPAQPPQHYWYYCPDSRAYYPYVKDCPAGWQRVSPTPQG